MSLLLLFQPAGAAVEPPETEDPFAGFPPGVVSLVVEPSAGGLAPTVDTGAGGMMVEIETYEAVAAAVAILGGSGAVVAIAAVDGGGEGDLGDGGAGSSGVAVGAGGGAIVTGG